MIEVADVVDMKKAIVHEKNREAWLTDCSEGLRSMIEAQTTGKRIPSFRISCGWPTRGALSLKKRTIGQCWDGMISEDGTAELFISPVLSDALTVVATVAHELVHAVVGTIHGHKKPFATVAKGIGLTGKMTATVAGEAFKAAIEPLIASLGKYPHAAMTPNAKHKAAGTRMLKCSCDSCDYIIRTTAKNLNEHGSPICPCNLTRMSVPAGFNAEGNNG